MITFQKQKKNITFEIPAYTCYIIYKYLQAFTRIYFLLLTPSISIYRILYRRVVFQDRCTLFTIYIYLDRVNYSIYILYIWCNRQGHKCSSKILTFLRCLFNYYDVPTSLSTIPSSLVAGPGRYLKVPAAAYYILYICCTGAFQRLLSKNAYSLSHTHTYLSQPIKKPTRLRTHI